MLNKKSGTKSAERAFEVDSRKIYRKIYAYALIGDKKISAAKEIIEKHMDNDLELKKIYYMHIEKPKALLKELHIADPRDPELAFELMESYISCKKNKKAIETGERHIEYYGNSIKVRNLLSSLIKANNS